MAIIEALAHTLPVCDGQVVLFKIAFKSDAAIRACKTAFSLEPAKQGVE